MQRTLRLTLMLLVPVLLAGCSTAAPPPGADAALRPAMVVGSAQSPDPVLERVRELERAGVVRDVVVYESFPVQIRLRASQQTLDELERIPRRGSIE